MTDTDRIQLLTPRQREVLALVLRGACDKEIADELRMAPNTVSVHLRCLFTIFDVHTRTKLMALLMVPRIELEAFQ